MKKLPNGQWAEAQNLGENINTIYSKRKSIYNKAHFKIDCNNINEKKITNNIVKLFYEI